jgi:hypothetical protein
MRRNDKAREDAEKYVNGILLDFISISIQGGLAIGTAGASLEAGITIRAIATAAKEEAKDALKDFVIGKFTEATCFTAGTPIKTLNGDKPIEEIKLGDLVLSYNLEAGELEYKQVVRTFIRESENLYDLFIQGEDKALRVTAHHPFFARPGCPSIETEGQWIHVDELHSGLDVLRPDGEWVRVVKLQRVKGKFTVYNFEVADNHDYFVGKYGILVHNADYGVDPESIAMAEADAAKAEGHKRGMAAAIVTADGQSFTGRSTGAGGGALNSVVEGAYGTVPEEARSPFHGCCAEGRAASQAIEAGAELQGSTSAAAKIGGPRHGTIQPACSSCQGMLKRLGVKF